MLNSDEFYAIKCILKYAWAKSDYDRYLAYDYTDVPYLAYEGQTSFPYNVARFESKESAIQSIKDALDFQIPDDMCTSKRLNIAMVHNNNKYHVVLCKIENNNLIELSSTNIAELDRHW